MLGMDIAFHSKALRDICESAESLRKHFGAPAAESIMRRLADLRAASSINDVAVGNPREAPKIRPQTMVLDAAAGYRILFRANHLKPPLGPDGSINWSAVSRIKLMSIEKNDG